MAAKRTFDAGTEAFLREHATEYSNSQFQEYLKKEHGIETTLKQIEQFRIRHGIPKGPRSVTYSDLFPREIAEYIREHAHDKSNMELVEMVNKEFGKDYSYQQVQSFKKNHKIQSGLDTKFKKGHRTGKYYPPSTPEAKARSQATQFKKGHRTHNYMEVGTIARTSDGYLRIKVGDPNKWEFLQRHIYEEHYGPLPEDSRVVFLDGNHDNMDIDNLVALTKEEYAEYMFRSGAGTTEKELSRARAYCAKINVRIRELNRK